MTAQMEKRACELAVYIIETEATVRMAAQHFGVSKSTVHKDIAFRLRQLNPALYHAARAVLRTSRNVTSAADWQPNENTPDCN